ncbi:C6 zinc finger domain containing protein [Pleurostoma richardsiae]|uniref:C6 zinc finger domain containing protein n=1 Tax=Pleurostoma richardsiae TaxID=41990 RepID=A0AA38RQ85_9PEZI|nr:C6 zinc finger domain containing protein [Pleurostoma richardsiae]
MRRKACDSCHRKKIHCDAAVPQCNWCKHHDLTCSYNRVSRLKSQSKTTRDDLARRLDRLESRLTDIESASIAPSSPSSGAADTRNNDSSIAATPNRLPLQPAEPAAQGQYLVSSFGKLHFAGYQLGEISSHCGIPLFSVHGREWIKSRTGEDAGSEILGLSGAPRKGPPIVPFSLRQFEQSATNLDLPPREVVETCVEAFRASHYKMVFPTIDTVLFQSTIDLAYRPQQDESPSLDSISAKACIFSFLSVISVGRLEFGHRLAPNIDGDACAFKTQHLMPYALQETNLVTLQTLVMLPSIDPGQPVSARASDRAWREKIHLRKVFWLCYTFDKDMAIRTGHPPCMGDENCDLTFPHGYLDRVHNFDGFDASLLDEADVPWLPGDLRLTLIKSKTFKVLYSVEALQKPDAVLLRDIRELDDELERWRVSLPAHAQPKLFYSREEEQIDLSMMQHAIMHTTIIHFEYHYLLATIHRAVGRCRAWRDGAGSKVDGLKSSLSISVEASRATIFYLRQAINYVLGEAFWLVVFYPMSAVLTLFCNIMLDPLEPRASDDLELLNLAPELLKAMRSRELLTQNEIANMDKVDSFVAELIRLGSQAIAKAETMRAKA